jgi:copper chaperone CopZ
MSRLKLLAAVLGLSLATLSAAAWALDDSPQKNSESKSTKATFVVTGLHCPPCTRTVESSLAKVKGIRAVKVDWKTKNAHIEFDEKLVSAQQVSRLIANTPHMMGGNMHYGGWLALKAPEVQDEASAKRAQAALAKVKGVKSVKTYPAQHAVSVLFDGKGELTTQELIATLKEAGFQAKQL